MSGAATDERRWFMDVARRYAETPVNFLTFDGSPPFPFKNPLQSALASQEESENGISGPTDPKTYDEVRLLAQLLTNSINVLANRVIKLVRPHPWFLSAQY